MVTENSFQLEVQVKKEEIISFMPTLNLLYPSHLLKTMSIKNKCC